LQLLLNGQVVAGPTNMPAFLNVNFPKVTYAPGTLTAQALNSQGQVIATDNTTSWGAAAAIQLTLDAPNPAMGTGGAVYLDGEDVALVLVIASQLFCKRIRLCVADPGNHRG
jgi:hypothetical protein